jgi:hypothetical protein
VIQNDSVRESTDSLISGPEDADLTNLLILLGVSEQELMDARVPIFLLRNYSEDLKLFPVLMPLWPDGLQPWISLRVM